MMMGSLSPRKFPASILLEGEAGDDACCGPQPTKIRHQIRHFQGIDFIAPPCCGQSGKVFADVSADALMPTLRKDNLYLQLAVKISHEAVTSSKQLSGSEQSVIVMPPHAKALPSCNVTREKWA